MSDFKCSDSNHGLGCMQNEMEQDTLSNDEKFSITNKEDIRDENIIDEDIPILDEIDDDVSQDINPFFGRG